MTITLEEMYGPTGVKGQQGIDFVVEVLRSWDWWAYQCKTFDDTACGKKICFQAPHWVNSYTAEVKNNMDNYGSFYVDATPSGWLFDRTKTSDRVFHCNTLTGWVCWYDRQTMKDYILNLPHSGEDLIKIRTGKRPSFIHSALCPVRRSCA